MYFDLEEFFAGLHIILTSEATEAKASKVLSRLRHFVNTTESYAIECGHLPRKRRTKK